MKRNPLTAHSRFPRKPFGAAGDAGTALVTALLLTMLLFGIAGAYLLLSYGGYENSQRELATVQARLAADDGLDLSMAELKSGVDADADGLGTLTATGPDGRVITVTATDLGANFYRIHSSATLRRSRKAADLIVERVPAIAPSINLGGAIVARGPVAMLGTITVDGRDWNALGTTVVGSGVYGISSMSSITTGGSAKVGGNGISPKKHPPAVVIDPYSTWTDGDDDDGDDAVDEEPFDGLDNDGDDLVDEDTNGFPTSPDVVLHLAPDTLKNAAIATDTYFTSAQQVDACIAANGGSLPGGRIIFCDFDLWQPVNLGAAFNSEPSILVFHNATSSTQMTNVTGYFKGLILCDRIQHFTGTLVVLGGVLSFAEEAIGNAFGLGTALIRYSSEVLANLPAAGLLNKIRVKSWIRSAAQ